MSEVAAAPAASTPSAPPSGGGSSPAPSASEGSAAPAKTQAVSDAAPAKPAPRKLPEPVKLKVKGREESIDDLDRLVHLASKGYGAHESFEEAKKLREEAAADAKKLEAFKSGDPKAIRAALRELGLKPEAIRQMSEEELFEAIQAEQMTPEQKELADLKAWKAQQEEKQKTEAQKAEEAAQNEANEREYTRLESLFAGALQKTGAPARAFPWLMQRMAKLEERNAAQRIESTPEDLASEALEDVRAEQMTITKDMSGEDLISWLGPETLKKIRKADLAALRARNQPQSATPPPTQQTTSNNNQPQKPRRFDWSKGRFVEE